MFGKMLTGIVALTTVSTGFLATTAKADDCGNQAPAVQYQGSYDNNGYAQQPVYQQNYQGQQGYQGQPIYQQAPQVVYQQPQVIYQQPQVVYQAAPVVVRVPEVYYGRAYYPQAWDARRVWEERNWREHHEGPSLRVNFGRFGR